MRHFVDSLVNDSNTEVQPLVTHYAAWPLCKAIFKYVDSSHWKYCRTGYSINKVAQCTFTITTGSVICTLHHKVQMTESVVIFQSLNCISTMEGYLHRCLKSTNGDYNVSLLDINKIFVLDVCGCNGAFDKHQLLMVAMPSFYVKATLVVSVNYADSYQFVHQIRYSHHFVTRFFRIQTLISICKQQRHQPD